MVGFFFSATIYMKFQYELSFLTQIGNEEGISIPSLRGFACSAMFVLSRVKVLRRGW